MGAKQLASFFFEAVGCKLTWERCLPRRGLAGDIGVVEVAERADSNEAPVSEKQQDLHGAEKFEAKKPIETSSGTGFYRLSACAKKFLTPWAWGKLICRPGYFLSAQSTSISRCSQSSSQAL